MQFKYAPYSFSKMNTYLDCPRKFKYNYITKAPKSETDLTPLLKGGAIHNIIENYPNPPTNKLAPKYQHIADRFIESDLGKKYIFTKSVNEASFGLDENFNPVEYNDKSAIMRGYIDHVCIIDGIIHIQDFKSGKLKDEKYQDYNQLKIYAIYFFQKYKVEKIRISYVYIEHENQENPMILEIKYLDSYINTVKEYLTKVETDNDFNKNETHLCNWCSYKEHCSSEL